MDTLYKTSLNVPSFLHIKQNLELLLVRVFGKELVDELTNDREEYNDFVHFIRTELTHDGDKNRPALNLSWFFIKHRDKRQKSLPEGMHIYCGRLHLFPNVIRSILKEVGENISYLLEASLKELTKAKDQPVAIVLVGSLSRSGILQNIIKSAFPAHVLITLKDSDTGLDAVKGAVLFGKLMNKIHKVIIKEFIFDQFECKGRLTLLKNQCAYHRLHVVTFTVDEILVCYHIVSNGLVRECVKYNIFPLYICIIQIHHNRSKTQCLRRDA